MGYIRWQCRNGFNRSEVRAAPGWPRHKFPAETVDEFVDAVGSQGKMPIAAPVRRCPEQEPPPMIE
ncbi:MAG: hypothetical protein QFF03_19035, partial [Pseudomonadota bacterium]|nr:hypothetical protein [Pseudomonadota bacterium]